MSHVCDRAEKTDAADPAPVASRGEIEHKRGGWDPEDLGQGRPGANAAVKAGMREQKYRSARSAMTACGAAAIAMAIATAAPAETIGGALIKSYLNNPDINAQRAAVRASDEGMPLANSGYLPTVQANLNAGVAELNA